MYAKKYDFSTQKETLWKLSENIWSQYRQKITAPGKPFIGTGLSLYRPVVRIRKENDEYFLTYKSKGLLAREEYNLPLTKEAYAHLLEKADGIIITKIPATKSQ